MGKFITPLDVRLVTEESAGRGERWVLLAPLIYQSNNVGLISVPEGFTTDFASVPRLPIAYMLTGGLAKKAAVLHDFLYSKPHDTGSGRIVTRLEADNILLGAAIDGMKLEGDSFKIAINNQYSYAKAKLMWAGVRIGGSSHWED